MKLKILWILLAIIYSSILLYSNELAKDTISVKSMQDDTSKANLLLSISERLYDFDTDLGIKYATNGLNLSKKLNFQAGIARAYKAYGINYWRKGIYEKAIENMFIAIDLYENINDELAVCKCYNNVGLILFARNDIQEARKYFGKGFTIAKKLKNYVEQARIKHNLGLMEFEYGNKDTAFLMFKESYHFTIKANEQRLMAFNEVFLGRSFTHYKKFDSAFFYLTNGLKRFEKLDAPNNVAMAYNMFANFYNEKKDYQKAIEYADKARDLGKSIGNKYMIMESAKFKTQSYIGLNDYKKALEIKTLYYELADTMKNETNIQTINELKYKFEYEQQIKDLKIAKEKEVYKNQMLARTASIVAVLFLIFSVIVLIFLKWKNNTNLILKKQNEEISNLNEKLKESNSTKDKFFSIIAHDLKNPIGVYKNISTMLYEDYNDFEEDERLYYLKMLKDSSESVSELLINLLDWSRSKRGMIQFEPQNFNLQLLFDSIVNLIKISAQNKNITLKSNLNSEFGVFGDVNLINTVIRNLVSNAIKFTQEGGTIEIGAIYKSSEGLEQSEDYIHIYVKDSGIGIPKEIMEKLFRIDVNVTSEGTNKEKGTGLGLILCKEFVEKHGGKIWVESEVGKGSTFWFSIPKEK